MPMHRLLYTSRSSTADGTALAREGRRIAGEAAAANQRVGLTGALLLVRGFFVQCIEGPLGSLETTFERICRDLRHHDLQLLDFTPTGKRIFPHWSMGVVTAADAVSFAGSLDDTRGFLGLDPSEALACMRRALQPEDGEDAPRLARAGT